MPLDTFFQEQIQAQQSAGLLRQLPKHAEWEMDFSSNTYLDLGKDLSSPHEHPSGSRLLGGNHGYLEKAEAFFAGLFKAHEALLFNSGYTANLGFWSTIPQKQDLVLFDRKVHASIRDGIKLGNADAVGFKHNSVKELGVKIQRLKIKYQRVFIAVESVYSMDGDLAPLQEFAAIADKWGAYLVVDEAHGAGTSFPSGRGWVVDLGLEDRIPFRLVTLGKAMGLHGAFWLGSNPFCQYLVNACRPFIYTTALPPSLFNLEWGKWKEVFDKQVKKVQSICAWVHDNAQLIKSEERYSPIKYLPIGDSVKALALQNKLSELGIRAQAVRYPTVPKGEERIRICLRASHSIEDVQNFEKQLML